MNEFLDSILQEMKEVCRAEGRLEETPEPLPPDAESYELPPKTKEFNDCPHEHTKEGIGYIEDHPNPAGGECSFHKGTFYTTPKSSIILCEDCRGSRSTKDPKNVWVSPEEITENVGIPLVDKPMTLFNTADPFGKMLFGF